MRMPGLEPMSDEPIDLGDPENVKELARNAKGREAIKRTVLRNIMGSKSGRGWMFELLATCHVYETSFSANALNMAYSEGERNIGLRLVASLAEACPERYLEMMREGGDVG